MKRWLILIYKIPREPSAGRVHIWRKLKQLGAIALQDAAWILPQSSRTKEQFQWLATEVTDLGGDAVLYDADQVYASDPESLKKQFCDLVDTEYREILAALQKKDCDVDGLSKRYQNVRTRDYFNSELGRTTRESLLSAGERQES